MEINPALTGERGDEVASEEKSDDHCVRFTPLRIPPSIVKTHFVA